MKWLNGIVTFIVTVGNLPPRTLLTFLVATATFVGLLILVIRLSGLKKVSLTEGVEFAKDPLPTPKKPVGRVKGLSRNEEDVLRCNSH